MFKQRRVCIDAERKKINSAQKLPRAFVQLLAD